MGNLFQEHLASRAFPFVNHWQNFIYLLFIPMIPIEHHKDFLFFKRWSILTRKMHARVAFHFSKGHDIFKCKGQIPLDNMPSSYT
jgi:hypothetical protein